MAHFCPTVTGVSGEVAPRELEVALLRTYIWALNSDFPLGSLPFFFFLIPNVSTPWKESYDQPR